MTFTELLAAVRNGADTVVIPSLWAQGRASFGGLAGALVYQAMRNQVAPGRAVRSLAITFVGPITPDVPVSFEVEVLREGKAVSQVMGRAVQNGQVMTLMQGSFGAARESIISVDALPAPQIKAPEECQELPYIAGVTPEFIRFLAMRWGIGGMPYTGNQDREMGGWVQLRGETQVSVIDEAHILALVDAWPPALLPQLSSPAPGSSLTWTIEFVQPVAELTTDDWCLYRAQIEYARDGYGHVAAQLWTSTGQLIAISRQTVAVFA